MLAALLPTEYNHSMYFRCTSYKDAEEGLGLIRFIQLKFCTINDVYRWLQRAGLILCLVFNIAVPCSFAHLDTVLSQSNAPCRCCKRCRLPVYLPAPNLALMLESGVGFTWVWNLCARSKLPLKPKPWKRLSVETTDADLNVVRCMLFGCSLYSFGCSLYKYEYILVFPYVHVRHFLAYLVNSKIEVI